MGKGAVRWGIGWVVLAAAAACDSTGDATGKVSAFSCQSDSDCPSDAGPARCVSGRCELLVSGWSGNPGCDACVSTAAGGSAAGSTGGRGGTTGPSPTCDAGGCPPPAGGSLEGTWDVIGSRLGEADKGAIVTFSSQSLVIADWAGTFVAMPRGNTFEMGYWSGAAPPPLFSQNKTFGSFGFEFTATRTDGPGSAGIVPLPLFGRWDAHYANNPGCTITAAPDAASATCSNVLGLPTWMQKFGNATLQATRVQSLDSAFGDFGGEWRLTTGVGASCTIRFEGTTISADCANAADATGNGSITFDGDTAHGSTSKGIEFTAQRL